MTTRTRERHAAALDTAIHFNKLTAEGSCHTLTDTALKTPEKPT